MKNEMNVNIRPQDLENLKCEKCAGELFIEAHAIKKISPILSGASATQLMPMTVLVCMSCKHVNKDFQEALSPKIEL